LSTNGEKRAFGLKIKQIKKKQMVRGREPLTSNLVKGQSRWKGLLTAKGKGKPSVRRRVHSWGERRSRTQTLAYESSMCHPGREREEVI